MFLNTLGKNEMYHSVAEIMGTDIEHIKEYVKENADDIVGCGYNEYCKSLVRNCSWRSGKIPDWVLSSWRRRSAS